MGVSKPLVFTFKKRGFEIFEASLAEMLTFHTVLRYFLRKGGGGVCSKFRGVEGF